jgi:hypothetical protein
MEELIKKGWVIIFKSIDSIDVNLKKSKLIASGVEAITFDHQDSMMTSLNDTNFMVSLFVHKNDEEKAKGIIE